MLEDTSVQLNFDTDFGFDIGNPADIRSTFKTAREWKRYVKLYFPELNPDEEYRIKQAEVQEGHKAYKQKRMLACLQRHINIKESPLDGDCRVGFARCGEVDCPFCGPHEIGKIRDALLNSMEKNGGELRRVVIPENESERAKFARKYPGASTTTFEKDGKIYHEILIATKDGIGEAYTEADLNDGNLRRWVDTVSGHNKSGTLHKPEPKTPAPKEDKEEVDPYIPQNELIVIEESTIDFSKCNEVTGKRMSNEGWARWVVTQAIIKSIDLTPKTLPELIAALKTRRKIRQQVLSEIGAVVFHVEYLKLVVDINRLNWEAVNEGCKKVKNVP